MYLFAESFWTEARDARLDCARIRSCALPQINSDCLIPPDPGGEFSAAASSCGAFSFVHDDEVPHGLSETPAGLSEERSCLMVDH